MLHVYIGVILASLQFFIVPLNAYAEEALSQASDSAVWVYVNKESGFITSLPTLTSRELIQEMGRVSSNLQNHKLKLIQDVEAKEFKTSDSLIALIMPGGLFYAATIKLRHKQAIQQLSNTTAQLDEVNRNLTEFAYATDKTKLLLASN